MTEHTETHALADYWREHFEAWQTRRLTGSELQSPRADIPPLCLLAPEV